MLKLAKNIDIQTLGDQMVLLNQNSGDYFGLNTTGASIVEQIQHSPSTVESISSRVAAQFEVDERQVAQDVSFLVDQMIEAGILTEDTQ